VPVVRDATPGDAGAVSRIGRAVLPVQLEGLVDAGLVEIFATQSYEPSAVAECISRCTTADDAVFLVAEVDGAVVGYLHYDSFGHEPELYRIYIDQRFQGQGVDTYILHVVKGNDGAVRFYERHGLTQEDVIDGIEHYAAAGIDYPPDPKPYQVVVMRFRSTDAS
jgi:ribosomal protein S18 acetylase RimI-like enzyme